MEKNYKRIPFTIELAKKITSGEVEGRIVAEDGRKIRVMALDAKHYEEQGHTPILILAELSDKTEVPLWYRKDGSHLGYFGQRLVIELPEETPKHEFKTFDKVLVRYGCTKNNGCGLITEWTPAIFQSYNNEMIGEYLASGIRWNECIPYEGNEYLVGTTDNPKEE